MRGGGRPVSVAETLSEVEVSGAALLLDGDRIRIRYPEAQQHEELATQIAFLRAHRDEDVPAVEGG